MSIFDYEEKDYDEYTKLTYYSRDKNSNVREVEMKVNESDFPTLVDTFLSFCGMVFEWDRKDIKLKALEAVQEFEV